MRKELQDYRATNEIQSVAVSLHICFLGIMRAQFKLCTTRRLALMQLATMFGVNPLHSHVSYNRNACVVDSVACNFDTKNKIADTLFMIMT